MSTITTAFRLALVASTLVAVSGAADAKPRRLVVLEFDGPRTEADASHQAVVNVLNQEYDVVATKRWTDARSEFGHNNRGPSSYSKAAKQSGVDAIVEGWVDDQGSYKMLTVQVRDAKSGSEIDKVTVKLGKSGITTANTEKLRGDLDELLEWVEPGVAADPMPSYSSDDVKSLSSKRGGRARQDADAEQDDHTSESSDDEISRPSNRRRASRAGIGRQDTTIAIDGRASDDPSADDDDDGISRRRPSRTRLAPKPRTAAVDNSDDKRLTSIFGNESVESTTVLHNEIKHVPVQTPRFFIEGGGYYSSRTLNFDSEDESTVQYQGAGSKGISFKIAAYPFPKQKVDGVASGLGFSASVYKSPASTVIVEGDEVGEYHLDYGGWDAAVHYRQPLTSMFTVDGEAGYGSEKYSFEQDIDLDVPDTNYQSFHVGGELDLAVTERATVGVGAKYHYVTQAGAINSVDWYGPGSTSGVTLDGNFTIPLPKQLYLKGDFQYRRFTTTFDSPDDFAESAFKADDSTVNGTLHLGVAF